MATLRGISDDVKGRNIELDISLVTVGRAEGNTVVIDNPTVSSRHAEIVRSDDGFVLKDLGSTNGTRVNARDITESPLNPADTIQFGSIEFIFEDGADTRGRRPPTMSTTKVTEETGGGARPETFESISPFGAEKPQSKRIWFFLIALIGVLALGVVVYYFIKLIGAS